MIGSLKGIVDETADDYAVIDVGGVGYTVFASQRTLAALVNGEAVRLSIETHVREDHIHLYGFENAIEREWFRLLLGVQRVGSKMALSILGAHSPAALQHAILAKDTTAFSRISGVGPKLAERIVIELKDKALKLPVGDAMPTSAATISQPTSKSTTSRGKAKPAAPVAAPREDTISALVNLGFTRSDAYSAALRASAEAGAEASVDQLIRLSLKELAV